MKQFILFACLIVFSFNVQAQTFKIGANLGLPAADASSISGFALGADLYYMFANDNDAFLNIGVTAGFRQFFGKEITPGNSISDTNFLPLAGSARFTLFGVLRAGADAGYALGLSNGVDGGFYFRPIAGIDIADTIEIYASYESFSSQATWGNLNIGLNFEL